MDSKKNYEKLEKNLELINYWIDKADNKISILLGILPLVSAVLNYITSTFNKRKPELSVLYGIHDVISVFLIIVSISFFIFALIPKLGSSGISKNKGYPIYYGDICKLKSDEYKSIISKADDDDYVNELMNEIYYNSKICKSKMTSFRKGIIIYYISVLLEVVYCMLLRFFP